MTETALIASATYYSKSFLALPSPYQVGTPEAHNAFDLLRWNNDECHFSFEAAAIGTASTHANELACYFSPNNKSQMLVAGDSAAQSSYRDINAWQLGIEQSRFASTVEWCPRYTSSGLGLQGRLKLFGIHGKKVWLGALTSVQHVTTNMRMRETSINQTITTNTTETPTNVCAAFNQTAWNYGKICGRQTKTGFADITLQLGCELLKSEDVHLNGYLAAVIPTGNKPCACYLFEPILGNGHHWGGLLGLFGDFCLIGEPPHGLYFLISSNGCYYFQNKQTRSFDLIGKPWSRYMNVYVDQTAAHSNTIAPGINSFTQCVTIKPHYAINNLFSFTAIIDNFSFEFGYYLHARQQEEACLASTWPTNIALVGTSENGTTSKARTIACNYLGTPSTPTADSDIANNTYARITTNDLDLNSAAIPGFIENSIFGAAAYEFSGNKHLNYLTIGGSYHFGATNCFVKRWDIWAKLGITI